MIGTVLVVGLVDKYREIRGHVEAEREAAAAEAPAAPAE